MPNSKLSVCICQQGSKAKANKSTIYTQDSWWSLRKSDGFIKLPQIIGEQCVRLMFMYLSCVYTLWFMQINSAVSYHPLLHRNLFSCVFCCSYDGNAWRNCTQSVVSVCKSDTILWKLSHQRVNWTGWELYVSVSYSDGHGWGLAGLSFRFFQTPSQLLRHRTLFIHSRCQNSHKTCFYNVPIEHKLYK